MRLLLLLQVVSIVESGVASAAPAIGQNLQEAGQLLSKAGQEAAGQLQVRLCCLFMTSSSRPQEAVCCVLLAASLLGTGCELQLLFCAATRGVHKDEVNRGRPAAEPGGAGGSRTAAGAALRGWFDLRCCGCELAWDGLCVATLVLWG
jgi:hypothetical protein